LNGRGCFIGKGMPLNEQTKFVLRVIGKDLRVNVTKELQLADNLVLYQDGMKPSMLACALVWINHKGSREEFPKLGQVTEKHLLKEVKIVKRLLNE